MRTSLGFVCLGLAATALAACNQTPKKTPTPPAPRIDTLAGVDLNANLSVIGTEPFWALTLTDGQVTLEGPDKEPTTWPRHIFLISENYEDGSERAELLTNELTLILSDEPCSDGMSDRKYPLTAEATIGDEVLKGCAIATAELEKYRP